MDYLGLNRNPVKSTICKPEQSKIDFWTPEEYKTFSDGIKSNIELYTALEILYYTGMRKGELLALTLQDVDFDQKTITINKTLVYINGSYQTQTPRQNAATGLLMYRSSCWMKSESIFYISTSRIRSKDFFRAVYPGWGMRSRTTAAGWGLR